MICSFLTVLSRLRHKKIRKQGESGILRDRGYATSVMGKRGEILYFIDGRGYLNKQGDVWDKSIVLCLRFALFVAIM